MWIGIKTYGNYVTLDLFFYCVIKISCSEVILSKIGSNTTLLCPWTENPVIWYGIYGHQYSSGKSILSSLPSSLQERLDVWENNGYNLRINNISGYDEGKYECSSINGTKFITMNLMAPPTGVIFENLVQKGNEDQLMNITCKGIGGHPPPSLVLSKNGDLLASADNGTLVYTFQPSRTDDMSNITCTANHSELKEPLSVESVLYLNLKTENVIMESISILYEFDILNASCFASGGRPPTSFEWNLLSEYYNSSYEDVENISPTDTFNVNSVLSLQISRTFDNRKLACRAFDSIDKAGIIRSQTLEVYYSPSISIINQNLTVADNFTQLICQPQGNPIIYKFYQWEHHSVYGEKIRTFGSGLDGILKIPKLERTQRYQDTGIYKCFAENGVADKNGNKIQSGSVFIVNNGKPKVSILNPSNQCSKLGSVGSLVVKYLSWPPPLNLTWFKYEDNQNIKLQASENYTMIETAAVIIDYCHDRKIHVDGYIGILHINEVTLKDFTNYTVLIQNEFGLEVFSIFFNDINYRTNSDNSLFYKYPALMPIILFAAVVFISVIAVTVWKIRPFCRSRRKEYKLCDNGIEDNCKKPEIVQRDVEHGVYYDGDEVKVRNLSSTPESIYNEVNPRADEKIETSNCPPPSLSHETDRESKPLIPFRRTDDNSDFKRRRQPQVPSSSSDIYCSDDLDDTDRGPTPLFLNRRPGEETDVKMGRPTHPTIHRTDISFGNNECGSQSSNAEHVQMSSSSYGSYGYKTNEGSQSSNAEHVQMSSSPYASYGYKTNEASDRTLQPTRIRPDKQDCDLYGSHTNVNDSWNQPFIPDKKIEIDNDETFKMERDTKEDEN